MGKSNKRQIKYFHSIRLHQNQQQLNINIEHEMKIPLGSTFALYIVSRISDLPYNLHYSIAWPAIHDDDAPLYLSIPSHACFLPL
jgi:hypothetical protein